MEITGTQDLDDDDEPIKDKYTFTIAEVDEASPLTQQEDENHWAKKYKRSSIDLGTGLIGVIVLGEDGEDNSGGTVGWTPAKHQNADSPKGDITATTDKNEGEKLNLSKMDGATLLVEIDEEFNNDNENDEGIDVTGKIGEVTPRSDREGKETESANPFVKLSFGEEDGEYDVTGFDDADSHDTVEVTEVTLNGDNAMAQLNRVSATSFSLITRDLAVDKYKVEYTAVDDAGNEYEGEFAFNVEPRKPYEIEVQPGWNLVSLPANAYRVCDRGRAGEQPVHLTGAGLPGGRLDHRYPRRGWHMARPLGGDRRRLRLLGPRRTFESIETMLTEVDPAGTLPTVPVTAGWNLLGVLDIFQNPEDDPPGETDVDGNFAADNYEADNYFSSIPWKVSYTYDTTQSLWLKATPDNPRAEEGEDSTKEILNGKGYWVWSPTPSTLVP